MEPFLNDARLRALLAEADRLLDALGDPDATSRADVVVSVDAAHRDLGRRLHDLWLDAPERRGATDRAPALGVAEITDLEPLDDAVFTDPLSSDWVDALQDLLALLGEPPSAVDPVTIAVEAARIQWASVGLSERWARFPRPIQQALVGLVAARCRFIQTELPIDAGPVRALERLDAHRRDVGLSAVAGVHPDEQPESGSWTADALHWWDMLVRGIQQT